MPAQMDLANVNCLVFLLIGMVVPFDCKMGVLHFLGPSVPAETQLRSKNGRQYCRLDKYILFCSLPGLVISQWPQCSGLTTELQCVIHTSQCRVLGSMKLFERPDVMERLHTKFCMFLS